MSAQHTGNILSLMTYEKSHSSRDCPLHTGRITRESNSNMLCLRIVIQTQKSLLICMKNIILLVTCIQYVLTDSYYFNVVFMS